MEPNKDKKIDLSPDFVLNITSIQPKLFGFVLKRVGRVDSANELLQEINLTICRKADEFEPGTAFEAWAFAIARFSVLAFSQKRRRDRLVFSTDLVQTIDYLDEKMSDVSVLELRRNALEKCMGSLPPKQKNIFLRRYSDASSVKAIAADLDKTANSISLLLHRIRLRLLNCVKRNVAAEVWQ